MPVGERIGAVMRVNFSITDRHAWQASTALRVKPLAAPLDVTVGTQKLFDVVATIELINH
ncbi:hypothetical protein D3C86_1814230 [compost metagenome]